MKSAAGLTALAALAALAAAPPPLSTRAAGKGCEWKLFSSPKLGIEVPYQQCDFGYRTIDFGPGKHSLFQAMKDTGKKEDVFPVITVYAMKASETPEEAVRRVGFSGLSWYKKRHCVVVPTRVAHLGRSKSAYTISPDAAYAKKIAKEAGTDIPEPPCGARGEAADSVSYFEFHPLENPLRFVYVDAGQDAPLFDETRIKFLP